MAGVSAFEKYNQQYDDWFVRNKDLYQAELEVIQSFIPSQVTKSLEIGVGSGLFARSLGITHGIDPSPAMLVRAESPDIKLTRGVAEALPYADDTFDMALMVTSICFVDNVDRSLEEAWRVLKPGACLLLAYVDKKSALGREYLLKKESSLFYQEATFYSTDELIKVLMQSGFGSLQFKQTLFSQGNKYSYRDDYGEGAFVVIKAQKGGLNP